MNPWSGANVSTLPDSGEASSLERAKRPSGHRAAQKSKELPPSHSTTSSGLVEKRARYQLSIVIACECCIAKRQPTRRRLWVKPCPLESDLRSRFRVRSTFDTCRAVVTVTMALCAKALNRCRDIRCAEGSCSGSTSGIHIHYIFGSIDQNRPSKRKLRNVRFVRTTSFLVRDYKFAFSRSELSRRLTPRAILLPTVPRHHAATHSSAMTLSISRLQPYGGLQCSKIPHNPLTQQRAKIALFPLTQDPCQHVAVAPGSRRQRRNKDLIGSAKSP